MKNKNWLRFQRQRMASILLFFAFVMVFSSCGILPKSSILVKIMIGRDKQWIFDEVKAILDKNNTVINGKKINIETAQAGSGEAMDIILDAKSDYLAWMPASSTHINWANDKYLKNGNDRNIVNEDYTTVFLTPTVLAMPESLAKIMGYPDKKIGWTDILNLSSSSEGWGIYGKPMINPVRFAHTHPAKSNSGLNALIAAEYAFASKQKNLTIEDINNNSQKLKDLEKTIVHYGDSTSLLQKKLLEKGTSFIQYAVLYEYMVADMNNQKKGTEKIVCIYPKEGTIWGDVCFSEISKNIKNDEQKKAIDEIRKILTSDAIQKKGMEEYFFRPANINMPLSPKLSQQIGIDPKEPQTTLEMPNINIIDAILNDWTLKVKKRGNVVFDIDVSGSMGGKPIENVKIAINNLFSRDKNSEKYESIDPEDTISLISFSEKVSERYTVNGSNLSDMTTVINNLATESATSLYDSIMKSIQEVETLKNKGNSDKINMIIVLSDGGDNSSKTEFEDLLKFLASKEGNVPIIITIGYGNADEKILTQIADATGGKYYKGDVDSIVKVFKEIKTFF